MLGREVRVGGELVVDCFCVIWEFLGRIFLGYGRKDSAIRQVARIAFTLEATLPHICVFWFLYLLLLLLYKNILMTAGCGCGCVLTRDWHRS